MSKATLAGLLTSKPTQTDTVPQTPKEAPRKCVTLRLPVGAWKQLKLLGLDEEVSTQVLLEEAVSDFFIKRGLPPIG